VSIDSHNNLLWSEDGCLAAFGINDLAVIQTADATLICPREKAADLKKLTQNVPQKSESLLEAHTKVARPWGSYTILQEGSGFKVKKITVKPGGSLSKQYHHHRSEHWVVISGEALVETDGKEKVLKADESTFILKEQTHRLSNNTDDPLEIIEVQVGKYLGEDDIIRIEDKYGRQTA